MSFNTFIRVANKDDYVFLTECFNNSAEQNQFDPLSIDYCDRFSTTYEVIKKLVNERHVHNDLYIVNKNGKDVSFFTPQHNEISCNIGGLIFTHPKACKMSIITSARCLLLYCIIRSLSTINTKNIIVNTWHNYIIQAFLQVIPDAVHIKMFESQYLFMASSENNSASYVNALDLYKVQLVNKDFSFDCTM